MRILVDAHMIGARETGNETYIVNLLSELIRLPNTTCAAVVIPGAKLPENLLKDNIELIYLDSSNNWRRLFYALPAISKWWNADILHSTYISPLSSACARIVSVHDVTFKRSPQFFSPRDRLLFATLLPLTLRRVNGVITISQHAKLEIMKYFPYLKNKIHVTYLASSNRLFRTTGDLSLFKTVRDRYAIHSEFILAVGNLQPRKNLERLIEAFNLVHQQKPSLQLVIAGKAQWQSSKIYTLVTELGLTDTVVFTGYIPDEDLVSLYNMARAFVYPSLYEGFGLPVLEAMACGTPVVTSNTSSIPEVAGDAALLIDPYQMQSIAQAILSILNDHDLANALSQKGKQQAQRFSWYQTAQETVNVYQKVLSQWHH